MKDRDGIGEFLNRYGLVGEAVEVGSLSGEYARSIISKWNGKKLYLVDPWCRQDPDVYREPVNDCAWEEPYKSCCILCSQYPERVSMHRDFSPAASDCYESESLDFVYIDANHGYDAVSADIKAWWKKVKTGGVFGGHDFRNDTVWPQNCEVKRAVEEFLKGEMLPMHYTPPCGSWWIVKD